MVPRVFKFKEVKNKDTFIHSSFHPFLFCLVFQSAKELKAQVALAISAAALLTSLILYTDRNHQE